MQTKTTNPTKSPLVAPRHSPQPSRGVPIYVPTRAPRPLSGASLCRVSLVLPSGEDSFDLGQRALADLAQGAELAELIEELHWQGWAHLPGNLVAEVAPYAEALRVQRVGGPRGASS